MIWPFEKKQEDTVFQSLKKNVKIAALTPSTFYNENSPLIQSIVCFASIIMVLWSLYKITNSVVLVSNAYAVNSIMGLEKYATKQKI